MEDLNVNNFVRKELSKAFLNNFLKREKLRCACLKYIDGSVDMKILDSIIECFLGSMVDLEEYLYAYCWLACRNKTSQSIALQKDYKSTMCDRFNAVLNNQHYSDYDSKGITAYDVYTAAEDFPFNIHLKSLSNYYDVKVMFNEFGRNFIPDRMLELLESYAYMQDNSDEFNSVIYEDLHEDPTIECEIFSTYVPNSIGDLAIKLLAECSGLMYSGTFIKLGFVLFESEILSNFLKISDISTINKLLDIICNLIGYIDVGMANISEPRVISKDSPMWDFYKGCYSFNENTEFVIVSSYFLYDVGDIFGLKHLDISELEELDDINKQISNLLKL